VSPEAVGIVGSGAFATALGHVIATRGAPVRLWSEDAALAAEINERHTHEKRFPGVTLAPSLRAESELAAVTRGSRLVVLAVASPRVPEVVSALGAVMDPRHLLVHAIGATELPGGSSTVGDLLLRETGVKRVGVLGGPALAHDLIEKRPCAVVCASHFDEVVSKAKSMLEVPGILRVYGSRDLRGVELAAALAGAFTVAVGLADGLEAGPGPRALLIVRAVAEGIRLSTAAGARERTFGGLAGLGNLLVRGASERSDDYRLGIEIARGKERTRRETEGSRAAIAAQKTARRLGVRTPIIDAVCAVATGSATVAQAAAKLGDSAADEE
jgi:glycerol-3-phosphate dehydrogenase (NAD(P)+)